jgi:hypothetical protein
MKQRAVTCRALKRQGCDVSPLAKLKGLVVSRVRVRVGGMKKHSSAALLKAEPIGFFCIRQSGRRERGVKDGYEVMELDFGRQ